jgi:hypothetical protein
MVKATHDARVRAPYQGPAGRVVLAGVLILVDAGIPLVLAVMRVATSQGGIAVSGMGQPVPVGEPWFPTMALLFGVPGVVVAYLTIIGRHLILGLMAAVLVLLGGVALALQGAGPGIVVMGLFMVAALWTGRVTYVDR